MSTSSSASRRFFELAEVPRVFPAVDRPLRVLFLADDRHPANVVQDHIRAFLEHSGHRYTVFNSRYVTTPAGVDEHAWDAVVIHYSIFAISEVYLSRAWQAFVAGFHGPVAAIHEDEYQRINAFRRRFAELGARALFSCLDSTDNLERVYGGDRSLEETLLFSCLPGYIPLSLLDVQPTPIRGRAIDIVYRGRTLPPQLGRLAQEKRLIGEQMLRIAREHGLSCDISSAEGDRIYGAQWPQFLASGKAMLGVEGGASIFDFDGQIQASVEAYLADHPEAQFEEIWRDVLAPHEGNIDFRTITPKFFEAIAAGTVLVLYPGRYSGILEADRHFIPLARDGSNAADVVAKLRDDEYLQAMAERTRAEILGREELRSPFYVQQVDRVLAHLAANPGSDRQLRTAFQLRSLLDARDEVFVTLRAELDRSREESVRMRLALEELQSALAATEGALGAAHEEAGRTAKQLRDFVTESNRVAEALRADSSELARRVEAQDARIGAHETRIATQETRISTQETRIATLETRITVQEARMTSGRALLALLVKRIGARMARLVGLQR